MAETSEQSFVGIMSADEIWRGNDTRRCLTDELNAIDTFHESLLNTYAAKDHTHSEYLTTNDVKPIAITNNSNLNNVLNEGIYYSSAIGNGSNNISNVPDIVGSATFVLEVFSGGADNQKIQRITQCDKSNTIVCQRAYYNGSWGSWNIMINNQKVLWSGSYYMSDAQTATLSDSIANQENGIVLVFSIYTPSTGVADNSAFNTFFIPKNLVALHAGCGMCFKLTSFDGGVQGHKYIYVGNTSLVGHANNNQNVTRGGISYTNKNFVLRYVIGV